MKKINVQGAGWDSMFLVFGKVLTLLFTIISSKMMAEGLSLTEYGTYSQVNLVTTVGVSVIALGLVDVLNYYFSAKRADIDEQLRYRIINTVFFLEILAGVLLAVVILLGENAFADYFGNSAVIALLPVAAFLPVFNNLLYFYQVLCVASGKAKQTSVYGLIMTVVRIITIYFAVYVLKNLLVIYVVLVLQDVVQIVIYHFTLSKKGVVINPLKISKKHIKAIFSYGIPMGVYAATNTFSREIGKIVVGRFAGTEDLAIYTNCSKLLPVDVIATSFAVVLVPYIIRYVTEKNREQSLSLFSNYLKVGYYSVWILGAMLLITPQTVVSFLYDDKYLSGTAIFILYVFDSMLRFASMHQIMVASDKAKLIMLYSAISLGLNAVMSVALYNILGLIGPAVAEIISALVYTVLMLRKSMKLIDAKFCNVFDWKELLWLAASLVLMWGVCSLAFRGFVRFGLHPYFAMFVSMAVFGCSVLAIHFRKISKTLKEINAFKI